MSLRSFLLAPAAAAEAATDRSAAAAPGPQVGAPPASPPSASPPVLGLVCERPDGAALGAAAALVLLARRRLPAAVVALHRAPTGARAVTLRPRPGEPAGPPTGTLLDAPGEAFGGPTSASAGGGRAAGHPGPGARAWTLPAARRLASALRARGLPAVAAGRLASVALPDDPDAVLAAAERVAVTAAAARAATVVVVAGARARALDEVLARCDAVVVVTPPARAVVAGLAAGALAALDVPVTTAAATVRPPARALAAAGLVAPPDLRAALAPALDVHGRES